MRIVPTRTGNLHITDHGDTVQLAPTGQPGIDLDWPAVLVMHDALTHLIAMRDDEAETVGRPVTTAHLPEPAEAADD